MTFPYFGWNLTHQVFHLYILLILEKPTLKVLLLWYKAGICSWNLSEKVSLIMKIHFQFCFFTIWNISSSILSIIAWKAPASSWSPSEPATFFKNPRCFGLFDKFQDTIEISMSTVHVSRLSFHFLWLC